MSDEEHTPEELEAISVEVLQAIQAKVEEALEEIGPEKLSLALKGGLSSWKFMAQIGAPYAKIFKKISDQFKISKVDVWEKRLVFRSIRNAAHSISEARDLMKLEGPGGGFCDLFGGSTPTKGLSDPVTFLEQGFLRLAEAEGHMNSALHLYEKENSEDLEKIEDSEEET